MKRNFFRVLSFSVLGFAAVACSSPAKMAKNADDVKVECDPQVLEVVANKINATYTITFPEKYFNAKAELEVLPVLVYEGGEIAGEPLMLQGEKVAGNYKVVSKDGAQVSDNVEFEYVEGVEKSTLELRFTVIKKDKRIEFETPYKLADGANTTYMLVDKNGTTALIDHEYQKVIKETKEAQILYLINNATVRPSQLKSEDIKEFKQFLADLENDDRRTIESADIIAYASPDGDEEFNTELSLRREKTAKDAFAKITKKTPVTAPVNASSVSEDWEGFKELVENSDMQDKELILRVLSMYSDPSVREREIKNMSSVYEILADNILPQLRRARYIANIDYRNYSDEELVVLVKENMEALDEPALLYAATLVDDNDAKIALYNKAIEKYSSEKAFNNLAAAYLNMNKVDEAKAALSKVSNKGCEYYNNMGVVALRENNLDQAASYFAKSEMPVAKYNMAIVDILKGEYQAAAEKLAGAGCGNEALAYILNGQYDKALNVLKCECPESSYLRAVVAARQGDAKAVESELAKASEKECLKARAEKDIEFAKYRK